MFKYNSNAKLFDSTDVINIPVLISGVVTDVRMTWTEIVVHDALWQAFVLSMADLESCELGDTALLGLVPPNRVFVKNEINPNRKSDVNGTTPRIIINEPVSAMLCASLIYPGSLGGFKPLGGSRMMIGYGVTKDNIMKVVNKVETLKYEHSQTHLSTVAVSDDVAGFERNFSESLFSIAMGTHSRTLSSKNSTNFCRNYSIVRTDCVYLLPHNELVCKLIPALMPSGDLLTTLINCIGRLYLAFRADNDAIVAGDDCIDITDNMDRMVDNYSKMGVQVRDFELCDREYYFCSATLKPNGDHIPTESSFVDSFVRAIAKGESLTQCVTANIPRCIGVDALKLCFDCAERVHRLALKCGLESDYMPSNVVNYERVEGPLVYEANLVPQ